GAAAARAGAGVVAARPDVGCTAILRGALPTAMVAVTVRLPRSTTETSLEPSSVTNAGRPSGLGALPGGGLPRATVPAGVLVAGWRMARGGGTWTTASANRPSGVKGA